MTRLPSLSPKQRDQATSSLGYDVSNLEMMSKRDVEALRLRMHGSGEVLTDAEIAEAWQAFSTSMCAHWLIVDDLMFGNFAAWLISERLSQ